MIYFLLMSVFVLFGTILLLLKQYFYLKKAFIDKRNEIYVLNLQLLKIKRSMENKSVLEEEFSKNYQHKSGLIGNEILDFQNKIVKITFKGEN